MKDDILIELGEVSEKTMGAVGCLNEGTNPNQLFDPDICE